jgi:hypothetical protein
MPQSIVDATASHGKTRLAAMMIGDLGSHDKTERQAFVQPIARRDSAYARNCVRRVFGAQILACR